MHIERVDNITRNLEEKYITLKYLFYMQVSKDINNEIQKHT